MLPIDMKTTGHGDWRQGEFPKHVIECLDPLPGHHILDIGCGEGLISLAAAKAVGPNGSVTGVEINEPMLAQAQQTSHKLGYKKILFFSQEIACLDDLQAIQGQQFDAIICGSSLAQLESPLQAIRSWTKYLKPEGYFVTSVDHPRNFVAGTVLEIASARLG